MKPLIGIALLMSANLDPGLATAPTTATFDRHEIPSTVSPEAAAGLQMIYAIVAQRPPATPISSPADWDRANEEASEAFGPLVKMVADRLGVTREADEIGGVPVLRIRPAGWKPTGRTLLYIHGGGYVLFSAETSLAVPAQMAAASGHEVISIDYTLAPHSKWEATTDQILSVWQGILRDGTDPHSIGLLGDSAGGGLAAGSVLKMRDRGLPLPGALFLLSPWSDITATGDSYVTLAAADPTLNAETLGWSAEAYVDEANQKHPYVSPLYGDYTKPFPPTLIQVGTREIFLSHAVRHYQAIRGGGQQAVLDVYEGMPHVFQALVPGSPETMTAMTRASEFFQAHLLPRASD